MPSLVSSCEGFIRRRVLELKLKERDARHDLEEDEFSQTPEDEEREELVRNFKGKIRDIWSIDTCKKETTLEEEDGQVSARYIYRRMA